MLSTQVTVADRCNFRPKRGQTGRWVSLNHTLWPCSPPSLYNCSCTMRKGMKLWNPNIECSTLYICTNTDTQSGVLSLIGPGNDEQGSMVCWYWTFLKTIIFHWSPIWFALWVYLCIFWYFMALLYHFIMTFSGMPECIVQQQGEILLI